MVTPRRQSSRTSTSTSNTTNTPHSTSNTAAMKRKSVTFNEGGGGDDVESTHNPSKRVNGTTGFTAVNHQNNGKMLADTAGVNTSKPPVAPALSASKPDPAPPGSPKGSTASADDDRVEEYEMTDDEDDDEQEEKPVSHPLLNTLTALRSEVYTALNDGLDTAKSEDIDWLSESIERLQVNCSKGISSALSRNVLLHCQTLKVLIEIENLRCKVDAGDMTETELEVAIKGEGEGDDEGDESGDESDEAPVARPAQQTQQPAKKPEHPPTNVPHPHQQGPPPPANANSLAVRPKFDHTQAGAPRPNSVTVPVLSGLAPQHQHQAPPPHGQQHPRPSGPHFGPVYGPPPPMRQPVFLAILTSQRWDLLSQVPQLWMNVIPGNRYLLTTDGTIVDQNTRFYMMIRQKSSGHIMTKTRVSWPNEWQNPQDILRAIEDWHTHWQELTKPIELPKPREEKPKVIKIVDPSAKTNKDGSKTGGEKKAVNKADKPKRETKKYNVAEYDWSKKWVGEHPEVDWKNVTLSSEAFKDMLKTLNGLGLGPARLPNAYHTWLLRQRIIGKGTIKPGRSHIFDAAMIGEATPEASPGVERGDSKSLVLKCEDAGNDDAMSHDGSQLTEMSESEVENLIESDDGERVEAEVKADKMEVDA